MGTGPRGSLPSLPAARELLREAVGGGEVMQGGREEAGGR